MQVLFQLRNSTTDRRQGNAEVAAGGRETPGIDRSQQDGHRLQSIHGVPSANERVLPEITIYLAVLGGLNRLPTRSAVRSGWSKDDESDSIPVLRRLHGKPPSAEKSPVLWLVDRTRVWTGCSHRLVAQRV